MCSQDEEGWIDRLAIDRIDELMRAVRRAAMSLAAKLWDLAGSDIASAQDCLRRIAEDAGGDRALEAGVRSYAATLDRAIGEWKGGRGEGPLRTALDRLDRGLARHSQSSLRLVTRDL